MIILRLSCGIAVGALSLFPAAAQVDKVLYNEVKDSIVARFNRNDFKAIYQLADTSFTKNITEDRLTGYLKSNRNSGNIVGAAAQSETKGGLVYRLEFDIRDMDMFLEVTPDKKFSSFGLSNIPITLLATAPAIASNNPLKTTLDRSLDSVARDYFRDPKATGLSIGIIQDGKPYQYHYGETQRGKGTLPTSHTMYEIGSITKTFTATLFAQAVIDNKVALSDDIRRYLPGDFPNLSYGGKPITLQDLANHTSRLPTLPNNLVDQPALNPLNPESTYAAELFYMAIRAVKIDTLPGYKFEYSNWGIALLGNILEKVYGQSYAKLLKKYITDPLAMTNTQYRITDRNKHKMALPYSENGKQAPFQDGGIFGPAGDIYSDLTDMLRYLEAQLTEREPSIRLTHQPTRNNTGLGWGVRTNGTYRDMQHNGSTLGFRANLTAYPELNSGCVILANNKADMNKLIVRVQAILKQYRRK